MVAMIVNIRSTLVKLTSADNELRVTDAERQDNSSLQLKPRHIVTLLYVA